MPTSFISSTEKTMLSTEELSARIGVAVSTLQNWRTRRNAGEEIGPRFVKLGNGSPHKTPVRYRVIDIQEWEAGLTDQAAVA